MTTNPTTPRSAAEKATPRYVYKENLGAQMSYIEDTQRRVLMCAIPNEKWDNEATADQRAHAKTICDALNQSEAVDALVEAAQLTTCGFCGWLLTSQQPTAGPCESCLPLRAALAEVERNRQ